MSTSGRSGDALTQAAHIRAVNETLRPATDYNGLAEEALLARIHLDGTDEALAARGVARFTMLLPHGCTGSSCTGEGHASGRERMHAALSALGLTGTRAGRDTRKTTSGRPGRAGGG